MPKVGKKTFAYSPKGAAAAKAESKRTGMPMKMGKGMPTKTMKKAMKKGM